MPSRTSDRVKASRSFSDTFRTNRPPPIEVMVNRGRTPEVVCQVQDHAGGFGDTIEVTLKQKRSPRRMTIVYQDDNSDSDEGDVVIKTSRAVSRHRNRRSTKHQQVEDSSSSSSSSSSSESDTFSEDAIVEKKKTKKRAKAKKSRGNRKKSNKRISRNDELDEKPREAPAQAASATSLASPFLVNQCYVPTELLPTPPTSGTFAAEILHEQPGIRPVSSPHPRRAPEPEPEPTPRRPLSAFARRLGQHAPWMRFIGVKCDKSREPNHDRAHANSPTETLSSGDYRSGSSIEDYRHRCYGCDRLRSSYWQDERRPRKGEPIKPSLCGVCRHKLRGAYNKVLGPRGEDLSTLYWCRACGFRRSSRFHRQHGEPSESFSPLNSTCHICVDDQKRKREIREGKRRAIKEAGPMDNCSVDAGNVNEASPGGGDSAERTFSTGSAVRTSQTGRDPWVSRQYPGDKQKADTHRPRSLYHRPTVDPEIESIAEPKHTLRRARASIGAESVFAAADRSEVPTNSTVPVSGREKSKETRNTSGSSSGSKKSSKVPIPSLDPNSTWQASASSSGNKLNININNPSHVTAASSRKSSHTSNSKYNTTARARDRASAEPTSEAKPVPESHDYFATKPSNGTDSSSSSSGGFCNNSNDAWARLNIDSTLRDVFAMDPQELAARKARLMGMTNEVSPAPSICADGPRVWEIFSDEEA